MRILLTGGSKSGKSTAAQRLCRHLAAGAPLYYWATMTPRDSEDHQRVLRHIADREGWGFRTIERSTGLAAALPDIDRSGAVLLDSVTAALSEAMFGPEFDANAAATVTAELLAVSRYPAHFVCVCDDLWRGGEDYPDWTEVYVRGLAHVCRALAARFDVVCDMAAGLPRVWKGAWPL